MLKNDINVPLLATIGAISSLLLVTILLGVHAWYLFEVKTEFDAKWANATSDRVVELKRSQMSQLEAKGVSRADPEKGTFRIPLADAKKAVVANGGKLPK